MNTNKVSIKERIGYGFGDMASNVVVTAVSMFLMFYYTDVMGISAGVIGTIMFVSRIFDGLTDLGMGIAIDKTKSKHGKARPWLLWMAGPIAITTILMFSVPESWGTTATLVYVAVTYNLLFLIYTAINVPYGTLNALITQDQHQRSILNIFRMSMAIGTTIIISSVTMPLIESFGGNPRAWQLVFAIFSIVGMGLFILSFLWTKEKVKPASEEANNVSVKDGVKALFKNKYWVLMVLIAVTVFIFQALISGITVYYAQYLLNDTGLVGLLTMSLFIPLLVGMLFMAPVLKRFGKRNTAMIGSVLIIIGSFIVLINPESLAVVLAGTIIRGIGFAPLAGTVFAMLADTIEYGEWKTGVRTEGLVYSGGSFGTKVGGGLGAAIIGWILAFGGLTDGGIEAQPESLFVAVKFLFIFLPVILCTILLVLFSFYKLDKEFPQIMKDLEQKKAS
ncbi:glycoside/pentoside/hexuronide:cation symporter, GPH family [Evansella caseinilytica]|uniref:Glycoside/pentoside/hexuronide:cation symporter, GPH family n=1 Tax=Evansella caseinilytica TaxID=1503961 RepID=A0A1H3U559_9BACI|nr:MFS transporter [Evansella caseinilytica]SDZ57502.1 glycoside/pentoside/hexuronide:cation symporter, GPH family [Evansella caseinilytica]